MRLFERRAVGSIKVAAVAVLIGSTLLVVYAASRRLGSSEEPAALVAEDAQNSLVARHDELARQALAVADREPVVLDARPLLRLRDERPPFAVPELSRSVQGRTPRVNPSLVGLPRLPNASADSEGGDARASNQTSQLVNGPARP